MHRWKWTACLLLLGSQLDINSTAFLIRCITFNSQLTPVLPLLSAAISIAISLPCCASVLIASRKLFTPLPHLCARGFVRLESSPQAWSPQLQPAPTGSSSQMNQRVVTLMYNIWDTKIDYFSFFLHNNPLYANTVHGIQCKLVVYGLG